MSALGLGPDERVLALGEDEATRRILDMIEEQIRRIGDALRALYASVDALGKGETIRDRVKEIRGLRDEIVRIKRDLYDYIARTAPGLSLKEEWIRLTLKIVQIGDYIEGISYRLERLADKGWSIPPELLPRLLNLLDRLLEAYEAFRKAILALRHNLDQVIENCRLVEEAEKQVDIAYRETDLATLESLNEPRMHLIRTIIEFMENIADTFEDASDEIRLIALRRFA